jgi:hypothetical protein
MPPFGPISRRKLIRGLRDAGFLGPFPSSDHEIMQRSDVTIKVPNPHGGDISRNLLAAILKQAGISRQEWERL